MADANRVTLSYAEESTFGTDPGAGYDILRITSESLGQDTSFASTPEIRSLRDVRELNRTNRGVSGNIGSTCYFGTVANPGVGDFFRYAMIAGAYSQSSQVQEIDTSAAGDFASNVFTLTAGTFTNTPAVGDWIHISGLTVSAEDGWYKVTAGTSSSVTVDGTITNEVGATLDIYRGAAALNATGVGVETNFKTLHIQREYNDLSNAAKFGGCAVNAWEFSAEGQDIITNSFDIVGVSEVSEASPDTPTSSSNLAAMTAIDGVQFVRLGGTDVCAVGVNFSVANNIRNRYCLGTFGPEELKPGDLTVTGNIQLYLNASEGLTNMDNYLNNTATRLAIGVSDEADARGNAFVFDFPNIEFTAGRRVTGGRNQDVIVDLAFQALYDTTDTATMGVHLFNAA